MKIDRFNIGLAFGTLVIGISKLFSSLEEGLFLTSLAGIILLIQITVGEVKQ